MRARREGRKARLQLARTATSEYSSLERYTTDDLVCLICKGTLVQCVALQPCGHNFCATCASNHFAALLRVCAPGL